MKYASAATIVVAFIAGVLLIRTGMQMFGWLVGVAVLAIVGWYAWRKRDVLRAWWLRKTTEWRNDVRQLGLWMKLAVSAKDKHATATMAHQQQALVGRIMSPMNLFPVALVAIMALPLVGGIQEWRINRVKAERDSPCSDQELTRNGDGEFRTRREACATLGDTVEAVDEWRSRAIQAEAAHIRDVAVARLEGAQALERETSRRVRNAASAQRQGRRDNEALASVIGAGPPNLERSVCELAGRTDCDAPAAASDTAAPAVADDLPASTVGSDAAGSADTTR